MFIALFWTIHLTGLSNHPHFMSRWASANMCKSTPAFHVLMVAPTPRQMLGKYHLLLNTMALITHCNGHHVEKAHSSYYIYLWSL